MGPDRPARSAIAAARSAWANGRFQSDVGTNQADVGLRACVEVDLAADAGRPVIDVLARSGLSGVTRRCHRRRSHSATRRAHSRRPSGRSLFQGCRRTLIPKTSQIRTYSTGSTVGRSAAWAPVPAAITAAVPKSRLLSFILDLQSKLLEPGYPHSIWLCHSIRGPPPLVLPRGSGRRSAACADTIHPHRRGNHDAPPTRPFPNSCCRIATKIPDFRADSAVSEGFANRLEARNDVSQILRRGAEHGRHRKGFESTRHRRPVPGIS